METTTWWGSWDLRFSREPSLVQLRLLSVGSKAGSDHQQRVIVFADFVEILSEWLQLGMQFFEISHYRLSSDSSAGRSVHMYETVSETLTAVVPMDQPVPGDRTAIAWGGEKMFPRYASLP